MHDRAIESLAAGTNGDPFAVLGPHALAGGRGVAVRAFQPAASSMEIVGATTVAMTRRHPAGVFDAIVEDAEMPFAYELRTPLPDGTVRQAQDPYRLGPIFTPSQAHPFGEGHWLRHS